ncbi:class I SAM-dependent methyltransferase family protein [Candidatus Pacearchaeota archaeon]|nr:class I SAM-dependent methyltransferase family protein [Candidatus Pacearchaeota archaeon]
MSNYDILGNIAIVKFDRNTKLSQKKKIALELMKKHKNVRTVLEKIDKVSGRLRTQKTRYIGGERTREAFYRENGCVFRLNVDSCYFSPRLGSERLELARKVKKDENVLVMFGGVAPYAIVIAKNAKPKNVISVELGRECCKYAVENVKKNKLEGKVEIIQGDVGKKVPKLKEKFDRIIMARPNLKEPFLDVAFKKIKSRGQVHYYGFYGLKEENKLRELIKEETKKARKKIKIIKIKKAGEIGKRKFRWRMDFKILN